MKKMKNALSRSFAAAWIALFILAAAPCFVFAADAQGETPEPAAPNFDTPAAESEAVPVPEAPSDGYEYEYDTDAPWLYYDMTEEEYYAEFEPWRAAGQSEEEYWDEYRKNYEKELREMQLRELGFTDTGIPNVIVNGQALNFTGAKPIVRDGATLIPARAVLEALGATLSYDGKAKTLTAGTGAGRVVFAVGDRTALVTEDGRTRELELAAAPFIDGATASAYVPLRAVAEGFGFDLYWYGDYKIAEIVDKAALIAEIDADFTVLNALLQSDLVRIGATLDKAERTDVSLTAELEARYESDYDYESDRPIMADVSAALASTFTILADFGGFDVSGETSLLINGIEAVLGDTDEDPVLKAALDELKKGTPFDMLFRYDEADFFLRLPLLAHVHPLLDKDAWIAFRADDYGMDETAFKAARTAAKEALAGGEAITTGRLLYTAVFGRDTATYYGKPGRFKALRDITLAAEPFLGDLYMEKNGDVRTINLNRLELFNVFRQFEEEDVLYGVPTDYLDFLATVPAASYTLRITERQGAPFSAELAVHAKINTDSYRGERDTFEFKYDLTAEPQKASTDYSITVDAPSSAVEGSIRFHADAVSAETNKKPRTVPPAGSEIVSGDDL
jgi:hypothetical protein